MMEVVVTTGAIRRAKLVNSLSATNQRPAFYRPDALPVTQPTVSLTALKESCQCVLKHLILSLKYKLKQDGETKLGNENNRLTI